VVRGLEVRLRELSGARVGAGGTLAAVVIALALWPSGWALMTWVLVAIAVLILVGTVAPAFAPLDRLPIVGAARPLKATFSVDGNPDLRIRAGTSGADALLCIGLANEERPDVTSCLLNVQVPTRVTQAAYADHYGNDRPEGAWAPPTTDTDHAGESAEFVYWAHHPVTLPGRSSKLFVFRLKFDEPGQYLIRAKVSSPDLHEEFVDTVVLSVERCPDGVHPVTAAIHEGERLLIELQDMTDRSAREAVMAWDLRTRQAVPEHLHQTLLRVPLRYSGPKVGPDYSAARIRARLRGLYDARRKLDEWAAVPAASSAAR
jgi:hypothetical protein